MALSETDKEYRINEFLTRAVTEVLPTPEVLSRELHSGRKLTAYLGIDPTAPELHIGHVSQLRKLKRLQELGHQSILLIGDFTGMIGDPTDKSAARVKLTRDEVLANAQTYKDQAAKILDFHHPENPVLLKFNSQWLGIMNFADVVELASEVTVQQMLAREMFQKRMADNKPVGVHEFLYPLMQGWDSVAMDVDIEIGGSDQVFNMLVGRELIKRHKNKEKYIVAGQLLVDPTGRKIGKTEGNMITVTDAPHSMFHKVMLWSDEIVPHAMELCTTIPMEEIAHIKEAVDKNELAPIESKAMLALRIVEELHSRDDASKAQEAYENLTRGVIKEMLKIILQPNASLVDALVRSDLAQSRAAARRLIAQGGVRLNGETILDASYKLPDAQRLTLQVGKNTANSYREIVIEE